MLVAAIDAHPWPLTHLTRYAECTPGEPAWFVAGTRLYGSIPIFLTGLTYLLGLDPSGLVCEPDVRARMAQLMRVDLADTGLHRRSVKKPTVLSCQPSAISQ